MRGIRIGDKFPDTIIGPFDADALARYAQISGDDNPLHLDDAIAAGIGLAAPPVHGMKLLASFEGALKAWRPDLRLVRLHGQFVQPLLRGEPIRLSGRVLRVSEEEVFIRLMAHGETRTPGVIGEATLKPVA